MTPEVASGAAQAVVDVAWEVREASASLPMGNRSCEMLSIGWLGRRRALKSLLFDIRDCEAKSKIGTAAW